ncbi:protein of unknown function [Candidatus Nitrosocosmicus franklandus]|uniref:Uncharacterized protein n=1 Tax=Candidatus Nitrosocosmicus franklandianus TaxID=1798806 RepID=A0A484I804_9ARCH|nr:protein of unknown function [Candidatus Nitrosocosmicus franklandus]
MKLNRFVLLFDPLSGNKSLTKPNKLDPAIHPYIWFLFVNYVENIPM